MCKPDSFKINAKAAIAILFLIALGFTQNAGSQAQQTKGQPVIVSSVSSRASANGTVVSIAADGPLNLAQTWQDREGYHVVVPSAGAQNAIKVGSGIKVRQLDHTLEIVIQTKPGATVTVQPMANRLNLNVEGKLDPHPSTDSDNANASSESERAGRPEESSAAQNDSSKAARASNASANSGAAKSGAFANQVQPSSESSAPNQAPEQQEAATGELSVMSGATITITIVLGIVCVGLLFLRNRRAGQAKAAAAVMDEDEGFDVFDELDSAEDTNEEGNKSGKIRRVQDNLMKLNGSSSNGTQRKSLVRVPVGAPTDLYGAYQVDIEIGKLVHGHPHKLDVVASRAPDDRRAIEASLLKTLNSAGGDEERQRRARVALEEYGFVARQSAALLMSADPYERTSAARMLGDIKSAAALPFLLEALYDHEPLVRNQAVLSIGELKLPAAIGALLDIARKHPDVPGSLLSRALSACSVDGLDFFDTGFTEPRMLPGVDARMLAEEITTLEPAAAVQELPESSNDQKLAQALEQVQGEDLSKRSEAIKMLSQFSVRTSVAALAEVARKDSESSLRALAISSLAFINHESVFPAILIAMADESRGVRAAAARSLSRLSFDRADAYIRVTETDDAVSLRNVAEACIKAGIAGQGIDRLTTGDHQAYEAMSVVSLLVKAGVFEPLFDAFAGHASMDVRLTAIHVIGLAGHSGLLEQLRELVNDRPFEATQIALQDAIASLEVRQHEEHIGPESAEQAAYEPSHDLEAQSDSEVETQPEFEFLVHKPGPPEVQPEDERELMELESSGLPARPIA
jgi:HEAT repeat protein